MSDFSTGKLSLAREQRAERDANNAARLAWRCRRGLLELDLWLGGFLVASRATLQPHEVAAFERLLALSDMHILDRLQGLLPADDAAMQALITRIQHFRAPNRDPGNEQNSHPQL